MAKAASQLRRVRNTPKGPRGDRPVRGVTARGPCLEGKYSTGGIEALRLTDQITSPPLRTASHAYQTALDNLTRTTGLAA